MSIKNCITAKTISLDSYLITINPLDVLAQVNSCSFVKGGHLIDRLSKQFGQRHSHLLLHQRQPFVDLWMLRNGDCSFEENLLTLARGDPQYLRVVLVQQDARHTSKHLLEVLLEFGHILTVANNLKQVLISHKVKPINRRIWDLSISIGASLVVLSRSKRNMGKKKKSIKEIFTFWCFCLQLSTYLGNDDRSLSRYSPRAF